MANQALMGDGTVANGIYLIDPTTGLPYAAGGGGNDREIVQTTYKCVTAFTGASVGDIITCAQILDVTSTPTVVSTIWRNQTTAANLASAPSAANITVIGGDALYGTTMRVLSDQIVPADNGPVVNAVMHGLSSAGGVYVDVKVNPSGALTVDASGNSLTVGTVSTVTNLGTLSTVTTVSTVNSITSANLGPMQGVADLSSTAITSTTTTSAITPTNGVSYSVNIAVTAVSGTSPTMDVVIQESSDGGTNWFDVWHFFRITGTGSFMSPKIPYSGNRVRYVITIGGTNPSFTTAIQRQSSSDQSDYQRQIMNRTWTIDTINSTIGPLECPGARNFGLFINIGTTTTAPIARLEGSEDGTTWFNVGSTLTTVANSTANAFTSNQNVRYIRARTSTAGSGTTFNWASLKAYK